MRRVTESQTISLDEVRTLAQINLYPDVAGEDWLEFDSMINLRPSLGNRSRRRQSNHARDHRRLHCACGASMTEWQHGDVARERWWDLSLAEQFGHVGSEISRAIRWSTRNPETARAALHRGLELFDLMLDDPTHRRSVARLREIARAREVTVDFLAGSNQYGSTGPSLQKYFDHFALAARRTHLTSR